MNRVTFKLNTRDSVQRAFREFWKRMAKQTKYHVSFDEDTLVRRCIDVVNGINIESYVAEVASYKVQDIDNFEEGKEYVGSEQYALKGYFTPTDIVEDLSEKTGLCYQSVMRIVSGIDNYAEYVKNPPVFVERAAAVIRDIQLDELVRGVQYEPTGNDYEFNFNTFVRDACDNYISTPNNGLWDKTLYDSQNERAFAEQADKPNTDVACFLKFPDWYKIPTPVGSYEPDFGLVIKRRALQTGAEKEYYFVIEIKGTNDLHDQKALTPHEVARIQCAVKHFQALGIDVDYEAPIKEFDTFRKRADEYIRKQS